RLRLFDNQLELRFERNTSHMRKGGGFDLSKEQYLSNNRRILFGIANDLNGEIDPILDPARAPVLPTFTSERSDRYQTASPLYWIDAGEIPMENVNLEDAYNGTGKLPFSGG